MVRLIETMGLFLFPGVSWILETYLEKEKPSQDVNGRLFIDNNPKEARLQLKQTAQADCSDNHPGI